MVTGAIGAPEWTARSYLGGVERGQRNIALEISSNLPGHWN
jgi:hypothetical protein